MTLRVVVAEPGKPAEVREIEGDIGEALRALVGGWLECVPLWDGVHDIWLNEEGKLLGLEPNRMVRASSDGAAWDIVGTLVVAAHNEQGDTTSLTLDAAGRIAAALTGTTPYCRPLLASEVSEPEVIVADWPEEK